jgi:hypothetical protein
MGKGQAALNLISNQLVNVSQDCFAQASNIFKLDIEGDEVNIDGLTINATAKTNMGTCSSTTGITSGPLHSGLSTALDKIQPKAPDGSIKDVFAAFKKSNNRINMKTTIQDSIGVEVVNRCLAVALNSMIFRLKNARKIDIQNVTINQVATAEITECIANVDIRIGNTTQSLQQFLERNEDQYDVAGYKPDPPVVCKEYENAKKMLIYGASGAAGFVMIVVMIILVVRYMK